MKFCRIAVGGILVLCMCGACAIAQATAPQMDSANSLFKAGKFAEAGKIYAQIAAKNPKDNYATQQLGYIALLSNQLDDAQKWLQKAIALKPDNASAKIMLAEVFYRRDDFENAAAILNQIGPSYASMIKNYPTLIAPKLESFKGLTPYQLHGHGDATTLPFIKSEPLPVVNVRVNGSTEVTFFIDTGGSELLLDTDFGHELGVMPMGSSQGTFSGGQKAEVLSGKVDSVTLGDWTLYNVPVAMLPLRQLSAGFGVKHLDGCIGTNVLYHFLATLDYPHGKLVLRKKTAKNLKDFEKINAGKTVAVPIWIASDHFMVAWGQINSTPPALLFIDTGLAGAGVKLGESMLKAADIKLEEDKASEGAGGGGKLRTVPYVVQKVSLGAIQEENVAGLYDGPFPWENSFGFYLAGMVGHDFFKPYAVTFDFQNMRVLLQK
ncbi:MAG: aspartyl protease family protein [Candidatus Korobacteraceae bacterium]